MTRKVIPRGTANLPHLPAEERSLPPYGRDLIRAREAGWASTVFIVCGAGAWASARERHRHHATLVLPPGKNPRGYRWPVNGLDCLVFVCGNILQDHLLDLCELLLQDGASYVLVRDPLSHLSGPLAVFTTVDEEDTA